ncbi:nuclear transport factor 2 family protein [Microlunatus ginsengisoli]
MSAEESRRAIERYFDLMGQGADFAECYGADVTWLVVETGQVVRGPDTVRDYVNALHATMVDLQTRRIVIGEENAYLEGDCAAVRSELGSRIHYCIAYDIKDGLIIAMRCYGVGAHV